MTNRNHGRTSDTDLSRFVVERTIVTKIYVVFSLLEQTLQISCQKATCMLPVNALRFSEARLYLVVKRHTLLARLFSKKTSRYCHSPGVVVGQKL